MIYSYILTYKHSVHSINPTNVGHGITQLLTQHMRVIAILSSVYFVQYLLLYTIQITREHTYVTRFWKTLHIRTLLDFEKYRFEI